MNTREIAIEYRLTHWAGIMRERQASGLSIKAFCEASGFHENVYFYWQRKLRESACEKLLLEKQAQLPTLSPPAGWALCEAAEPEIKATGSVSVEIGKFKVTVNQGDDMELFTKVCQSLMPLC